MNQELAIKIIKECPKLFSNLNHIEAPDGWFNLIKAASCQIEHELKSAPIEISPTQAVQIKEKFGSLRFYVDYTSPYVNGVIALAEDLSSTMCQACGSAASSRNIKGCIATLCDLHFKERSV